MFFRGVGLAILAAQVFTLTAAPALGWSLKTHLWIAQEVLNDASDGNVTLSGREYRLPPDVAAALSAFPDRFRSGSLGPDVFPDPIVGQTTFHPGVDGAWQTDDWLRHLLAKADDSEERAFVYGFAAHSAGDIFAHTYVNAYTGDIFELKDERQVELRHFVLEKYIEARTPPLVDVAGSALPWDSLAAATSFARDVFIIDGDAGAQNLRAGTGAHLYSMHGLHHALGEADKGTQAIIAQITNWMSQFFAELGPLNISLNQARLALQAANTALDVAEDLLSVRRAAYDLALRRLDEARDIIANNPGLIFAAEQQFLDQAARAADLAAEAVRIGAEVANQINNWENLITGWQDELADLFCDIVGDLCGDLRDNITNAQRLISGAEQRRALAQNAAREAANLRDATRARINQMKEALIRAESDILNGIHDAAVAAAEADLRLQEGAVTEARKVVDEAQELVDRLQREVDRLNVFVEAGEDLINRLNPVTLFIRNWQGDVRIAAEEYIKASHRAGVRILMNDGNPIEEYTRWFECYGGVFGGVPRQVGQAGCLVTGQLEEWKRRYDEALLGLPEFLRWILDPAGEARRLAERELADEIEEAKRQILGFISDENTADFILLLISPQNATRDKLNEVFREDDTNKGLLIFDNVATMIDDDIGLVGDRLTPREFWPLQHSVTLAKLALLGPGELNRLAQDLSGRTGSPLYGDEIYRPQPGNFSLLVGAVRSIDGNHQWQAYGLPWPRRQGFSSPPAQKRAFGRDYFLHKEHGLRFWVDPFLRERVFYALFPGSAHGTLAATAAMQNPQYLFPECRQNPFPSVQSPTGVIRDRDSTCKDVGDPDAPIVLVPATPQEYAAKFLACEDALGGGAWTIAASHRSQSSAERHAGQIMQEFPDLQLEVWKPKPPNRYWTVMAATCTKKGFAEEARDILIRRGIASDAFLWTPRLPWSPVAPSSSSANIVAEQQ